MTFQRLVTVKLLNSICCRSVCRSVLLYISFFLDDITDDTSKLSLSTNKHPSLKEFRTELLNLHNEYRQKHGVPNLVLSEKLNQTSQEWAEYLSDSGRFEHRKNNKYGENIFFGQRRGGMPGIALSGTPVYKG